MMGPTAEVGASAKGGNRAMTPKAPTAIADSRSKRGLRDDFSWSVWPPRNSSKAACQLSTSLSASCSDHGCLNQARFAFRTKAFSVVRVTIPKRRHPAAGTSVKTMADVGVKTPFAASRSATAKPVESQRAEINWRRAPPIRRLAIRSLVLGSKLAYQRAPC